MRLDIERLFDRPLHPPDAGRDHRYRRLLPRAAWDRLAPAIRQRFSGHLGDTVPIVYCGRIVSTRTSVIGWLLCQLCRLIGGPLPLHGDTGVPATVIVSRDAGGEGQCWTRIYQRHRGPPQVIVTAKVFAGPTGIEEHVGGGMIMALQIDATATELRFTSDHYAWQVGRWRLRLPRWLAPGRTIVTHSDLGDGRFAFDLTLTHAWLGELVHQRAEFSDRPCPEIR